MRLDAGSGDELVAAAAREGDFAAQAGRSRSTRADIEGRVVGRTEEG
jgi:hypothetical protein